MEDKEIYSYLMLSIGLVLGILTVIFFALTDIVGISSRIKALLLFTASMTFLLGAIKSADRDIRRILMVLFPATHLTGLYFILNVMQVSELLFLLSLLTSIGFFIYIGLRFDRILRLDSEYTLYIIALLVILTGLTAALDIGSGEVDYLTIYSNTTSVNGSSIEVGYVVARNEHVFSREFNPPEYRGCVYPDGNMQSIEVRQEFSGLIKAGNLIQSSMFLDETENVSFQNLSTQLQVSKMESCPPNGTQGQVVMVSG